MNKLVCVMVLLLAGCVSSAPLGVRMSDEDRVRCAASGCTAWTMEELLTLIRASVAKGFEAGKASAKGSI